MAQTTVTNPGFESWGNVSPGISGPTGEPTNWYSNKSGSSIASIGPQTCYKDSIDQHSGLYCVKMITESYIGTAVNGVVTTGVVDAPTLTKSDGYVGTQKYGATSDDRRMAFTGRPDSLTGWYKYTPGGAGERGKIRTILHTGDYFDPETPTTYHVDPTANRIADDTFFTPTTAVATWTRFSVPFTYVSTASPAYIMINATSSANQTTTITGSTFWIDDIDVVYNACGTITGLAASAITATTATISWTPVAGSAGYVYAVDNSITPPASGTYTTSATVPLTGLIAGTTYYAHVYDSCGTGVGESAWVTVPFTTTSASGCGAVTGLAASSITSNSAVISWTGATGAAGAEYVINTTAADPTGPGTATTASNYTATGLTASTLYYAHVLDSCSATSLSAWVTISFTTQNPAGVNNIATGAFSMTAYPNPVTDELTIKINGTGSLAGQIQIIDYSGRLIKTTAAYSGINNISTNSLAAGMYFVRYTDAAQTQTIKINKQ